MARTRQKRQSSKAMAFDVIVAGGGLAGQAMAARLGQIGMKVLVVEREPREKLTSPRHDGRTTAIAYGSKLILDACGVWETIEPHGCPILDIRVADQQCPATVDFASKTLGHDPFGYIVENVYLRRILFEQLQKLPNVQLECPSGIVTLQQDHDAIEVALDNGVHYQAPLLIAADGRHSVCREWAGIKTREWSYHQTALVVTVAHERPHHNLAIENFYPGGPFAVLPMTENRSSIVWSAPPETAEALTAMPEKEFATLLQERGCAHLGKLHLTNERMLYPLRFMLADKLQAPRMALIGETAHGMHPIAGQGYNLSLRDIEVLAELVETAYAAKADWGGSDLLKSFENKRHQDHFTFMIATDVLEKLFSNNIPPLKWARQMGLGIVQRFPFAKNLFSRMAMGFLS